MSRRQAQTWRLMEVRKLDSMAISLLSCVKVAWGRDPPDTRYGFEEEVRVYHCEPPVTFLTEILDHFLRVQIEHWCVITP